MESFRKNRYMGLMASLFILIAVLSAGLAVNYQWSQKNAQILDGANYVGDLSDAMLHIAARANHLVILDDGQGEKRQHLLNEIQRYREQAEENLNNMLHDENMSAVPALHEKMLILAGVWQQYQEKIQRLQRDDRSHDRDLAEFVYTRLEPNHDVILQLYYDYFDESYQLIKHSNYLQITLAIFAFIYFIVLILTYFRRFIRRDEALQSSQEEMEEILQTIDSGLFLLEKDLSIGQLQSHRLGSFLGQSLTGQGLMQRLRRLSQDQELIHSAEEFIEQLYNPKVKEKLIESLNPLDCFPIQINGEERYLAFHFKRVHRNQEIIKVLVNIRDISSQVWLAQQQEEEQQENDLYLSMLRAMQKTERSIIHDFLDKTEKSSLEMNAILRRDSLQKSQLHHKLEQLWRLVHGIKGEASALGLKAFQDLAERFESELKEKQKEKHLSGEHFLALVVYLEELMSLTQMMSHLLGLQPAAGEALPASAQGEALYYQSFAAEIAQRQGKEVDCIVQGFEALPPGSLRQAIREMAIQMLRNAVVHGIETPAERSALGKLPTGRLRLILQKEAKHWHLLVEDDGRGFDYEAIRRRAVELGWHTAAEAAQLSPSALIALLFRPQFSTAQTQDGDAGRGVGLDMVQHRVQQHGGRLKLRSHRQHYTRFSFLFPLAAQD